MKNFKVFVIAFFIFISSIFTANAGLYNGKTKFYTIKTEHFYIHFHEGLGPIAEDMRTMTETVFARMSDRLKWTPHGRIHVLLVDNTEASNGLATVIPDNYINLIVSPPDSSSTLDYYKNYLEYLFTHELTHILHIDQHYSLATLSRLIMGKVIAPNGSTPRWMREGMAVYEESEMGDGYGRNNSPLTDMVIRTSYYEDEFPRIDQIAGLTKHFPGGSAPYLYGGRFFKWLAEKYGEDRMYRYQKEYAASLWLFSLNNKARKVYSKSFYKLWKEFKEDLSKEYEQVKSDLEAKGLTVLENIHQHKEDSLSHYTLHPDGASYAYYQKGLDESPQIVIKLYKDKDPIKIKRRLFGQMSFSKDGRYLAFSSLAGVEKKRALSEVFYYDTKKKKLFRAYDKNLPKKSLRATDPDFSSVDGGNRWIVMVRNFQNTDQLYLYDTYEKSGYVLTEAEKGIQFSSPRFSPDGEYIAVSRKEQNGFRDIVLYSKTGKFIKKITSDQEPDLNPVFSGDGSKIYFSSYKTGVSNIFQYDWKTKEIRQVSNVLDGLFEPMPAKGGRGLFVRQYHSKKSTIEYFDVFYNKKLLVYSREPKKKKHSANQVRQSITSNYRQVPFLYKSSIANPQEFSLTNKSFRTENLKIFHNTNFNFLTDSLKEQVDQSDQKDKEKNWVSKKEKQEKKNTKQSDKKQKTVSKVYPSKYKEAVKGLPSRIEEDTSIPSDAKRYNAFPHVLLPKYVIPNIQVFDSAILGSALIGRYDPLLRHNWSAFVNYRTDAKFVGGGGTYIYSRYKPTFYVGGLRYAVDWGYVSNTRFFEERWQTYAGTSFNIKSHLFNISYFYEHRSAYTNLAGVNLVNMKPYAGLKMTYKLGRYKKYPDSISQEDGYYVKLGTDFTNQILGADDVNEEIVVTADLRYYLEMPWSNHHVLGLRVAGGWVWGDVQQFGVFRLGGPFGEGIGAANYSSRVLPLRGLAGITYGGDRVFMFSSEYRLPLVENVNTGIGTWPVFLDKLHMDFFVDGGDIKYRTELDDLFTRMLVSVGAELKGNVVLGYELPMMFRLGYGIILTNRDRLGTLSDGLTGLSLKYGNAYFQVGTSF